MKTGLFCVLPISVPPEAPTTPHRQRGWSGSALRWLSGVKAGPGALGWPPGRGMGRALLVGRGRPWRGWCLCSALELAAGHCSGQQPHSKPSTGRLWPGRGLDPGPASLRAAPCARMGPWGPFRPMPPLGSSYKRQSAVHWHQLLIAPPISCAVLEGDTRFPRLVLAYA